MIKSIMAGPGLAVSGGTVTYPYVNMNQTSAGLVRYNGNIQNLEIYDGSSWVTMYSSAANVTLDYDVQTILNWARQKMQEDQRLQELAKSNPTVADAIAAVKSAEEKLQVVAALVDTA
mgnify:FL=1